MTDLITTASQASSSLPSSYYSQSDLSRSAYSSPAHPHASLKCSNRGSAPQTEIVGRRPVLKPTTSFNESPFDENDNGGDRKLTPKQDPRKMATAAAKNAAYSASGAQPQSSGPGGVTGGMDMQDPIWTEALFSDTPQQSQQSQQQQVNQFGAGSAGLPMDPSSLIDPALSGADFGGESAAYMWRDPGPSADARTNGNGAAADAPPTANESPAPHPLGEDFAQPGSAGAGRDLAHLIPKLGIGFASGSDASASGGSGSTTPLATTPEAMIAAAQRLQQQQAAAGGSAHGPSPLGRYYLAANDPQHVSRHPLPPPHASPGRPVVPNAIRHNNENEPSPTLSVASDETFTGVSHGRGVGTSTSAAAAAAQQGGRSALFPAAPGSNGKSSYQTAMASPMYVPFPAPNGPLNPTATNNTMRGAAVSASAGRPQLRQNTTDSFASGMSTSSEEEDITSPMVLPETSLRRSEHGTTSPGTPIMNQFSASPGKMSGVALFPKLPNTGAAKGRPANPYGQAQYTFTPKGPAPTFPPMSSSSSESETPDDESENPVDADYGTTSSGRPAGSVTVGRGGYDGFRPESGSRRPGGIGGSNGSNGHSDDEDDEDKRRGRPRGFAGESTPKKVKKPRSKSPLAVDEEASEEEEYVEDGVTKKRKISKEEKKGKKQKKEAPSEDGDVVCDYRDPLPVSPKSFQPRRSH